MTATPTTLIHADHTLRYGRSRSRDAFRATAGKNQRFMMESAAACFILEEREAARDDEEGTGR